MTKTHISDKVFALIEAAEAAYKVGHSSQAVEALEVARALALASIAGQLARLNEAAATAAVPATENPAPGGQAIREAAGAAKQPAVGHGKRQNEK